MKVPSNGPLFWGRKDERALETEERRLKRFLSSFHPDERNCVENQLVQ